MLTKLLKYDLKYMIKNMFAFYILAIFFALTTRILFLLEQTVIVNILAHISLGCLVSMIINIIINTMLRSWLRFRDFIYKDESYLTHTLPVTKNNIYDSKFIQTVIFGLIGFIVITFSLFIAFYTEERWIILKEVINGLSAGLNVNTLFFSASMIIILFLEILNGIQAGFLGIILGHKKNSNKTAFSALFGFISYILSQGVVVLMVFIYGIFNNNIMQLFTSNTILDNNTLKQLIALAIAVYTFIILIMEIVCKRELKKGVNVE